MAGAQSQSETKNAREGIETRGVTIGRCKYIVSSETKNAREGIETLDGWLKALPPDELAEIVRYAPIDIMLNYLPLLPLKLAAKVKTFRPIAEWKIMNDTLVKSGVHYGTAIKYRTGRR